MKEGFEWWSKLGSPQYGGEMAIRSATNPTNFDPYNSDHITQIYSAWLERLFSEDWTLDPRIYDYGSVPLKQFLKGHLAESWEFTNPNTFVVHLRKGIHWQAIPPVNGREFNADDVIYHYHRLYGLGSSFHTPAPYHATVVPFHSLTSVSSLDKYTVEFKWKTGNPELITETMITVHSPTAAIEAHEIVDNWGDLNDWHHAIGTGPFILKDFVQGESAILVKNPNYWGHDERYPHNKLPYIDTLKIIVMPDNNKALEALLAGKIDVMDGISFRQALALKRSNPEILQTIHPNSANTIDPRNDVKPFIDIRVRKAMQMALDLGSIARIYYDNTVAPYPSSLTSRYMTGWAWPYEEWPQDLKDEYIYNPIAAKNLLSDAGYPSGFATNLVTDALDDIGLLQMVKYYFAQVGIDMEIRLMESAALINFVQAAQKHDQLVFRSGGGALGSGQEPLRQLTRFQTGSSANPQLMISDPIMDNFYPAALAAKNENEVKKIFQNANEYVARQHFAISLLQPMKYSLSQPWLKGYNGQFGSISRSPQSLSFYASRFWIDPNLKSSMNHEQ